MSMTLFQMPASTPKLLRTKARRASKRGLAVLAVAAILSNVMFLGHNQPGGSVFATGIHNPPPTPVANPPLGQSCGLDIGLVVDTSGSMSGPELTQVKNALTGFTTAFTGTPTTFSLTTFATNATVTKPFSMTPAEATAALTTSLPAVGNENTNWDAALAKSFSSFDPRPAKPNLIVIATDGSPNRYGDPATSTFDWTQGLNHAITQANSIKTAGTRIVVVGIGSDPTDPDYPNTDVKLQAISGPNMAPPGGVDATTDVVKTDFDQLGSAMADLAKTLCGGKILVQKQLDLNGDGKVDVDGSTADTQLSGYGFTVTGVTTPATSQTTTNSGALEFSALNGTYTVAEAATDTMVLAQAECRNGSTTVGTVELANQRVSNLPMGTDDTISCTFVNRPKAGDLTVIKHVIGGTAQAGDFTMHIGDELAFPGSETGTTKHLAAGNYTVSESDGPAKYTAEFSGDCDAKGQVSLADGQEKTCTITNTREPEPTYGIHVEKHGPATIGAGQQMTYTVDWTVGGTAAVTNAVIADPLPVHTTFVSATQDGVLTGTTVNWNLGTKNPGDHGTVSVTVAVGSPLTAATVLTNTACMTTSQTDPACSTVTTTVTSAPILTLDKQGPATIGAGAQLTYSLTWTVSGNAPATHVVLSDPLPTNTTFVSADQGGVQNTGIVTWDLGTKNPGDHGTVNVIVAVASPLANGTVLTNTACLVATEVSKQCDTVTTTTQSAPKLSIVKTNSLTSFTNPGATVTYTVVVTNATGATDSAREVALTDVLPTGFTYVGGGTTATYALGTIAPGASVTKTYQAVISTQQVAGTYTNTASAKGTNTETVTATSAVEVRVPAILGTSTKPALSLKKSATVKDVRSGDVVLYTITVKNIGDGVALNTLVEDPLPAGMVNMASGQSKVSWSVGTLAVGAEKTMSFPVKITAAMKAGVVTNVATATATDVSPVKAKVAITIHQPQVLGLATTGVGMRDYLLFTFGAALIIAGVVIIRRQRQTE